MYNHRPKDYICPFCLVVAGIENEHVLTRQSDIIYRDDAITAFICCLQFANNAGHVLIIPNRHYEQLYELPDAALLQIHRLSRQVAHSMKAALQCAGVTIMQSNEPCGDQTVWHYHLHVIPRFQEDRLFENLGDLERTYTLMDVERRAGYATQLRAHLHAAATAP